MGVTQRVLHVDDDPEILSVSRTTADEISNFELVTAQTAAAALDAVADADVDAVITDSLETSEGVPLARAIRTRAPTVPVLVFTAADRSAVGDEVAGDGTVYLQKGSTGLDAAFDRVRTLCEESSAESLATETASAEPTAAEPTSLAATGERDDDSSGRTEWHPIGIHNWTGPQELGTTIVQLLTAHVDGGIDERAPLYESVDPDSLEQLVGPRLDGTERTDVEVRFAYEGHELSVSGDGTVSMRVRATDFQWLDPAESDAE